MRFHKGRIDVCKLLLPLLTLLRDFHSPHSPR